MVTALCSAVACADDADTPDFSFNGFGTLGLVHSSEQHADFTSSYFQPDGAGFSDDWSGVVDSLVGAQLTVDFTARLVAVVQAIAEENYDNTFRPHVEWANIKYEFTPDFSVRVGRVVLPITLLSATRKVGYTYAWVRPPQETYRLVPLTNSDGVDASYRLHAGELTNTVQIGFGRNDSELPDNGGVLETRDLLVVSNTAEIGALTGHVAYLRSHVTLGAINRAVFDNFRQFGPQGAAIADKYSLQHATFAAISLAVNYDPGDWFATGEWGRLQSHSFVGSKSWHVTGGYRFGQFMPYATYGRTKAHHRADPGLDLSTLPAFLVGPATALNAGLAAILSSNIVQDTASVGARWDFMKNASFKLQLDHMRRGAGSNGTLVNIQPGFRLGGAADIFSASIDFVF